MKTKTGWTYVDEAGHTWTETKERDETMIECYQHGYIHLGTHGIEINGIWDGAFSVSRQTFATLINRIEELTK